MVAYFSADALRPCSESQPTAPVQKKENYLSQKSANVKTHRILLGTAIGKEKAEKGKKGEASLGAEALKKLSPSKRALQWQRRVAKEESSLMYRARFDWSIWGSSDFWLAIFNDLSIAYPSHLPTIFITQWGHSRIYNSRNDNSGEIYLLFPTQWLPIPKK